MPSARPQLYLRSQYSTQGSDASMPALPACDPLSSLEEGMSHRLPRRSNYSQRVRSLQQVASAHVILGTPSDRSGGKLSEKEEVLITPRLVTES